jgi:hypothetical protein
MNNYLETWKKYFSLCTTRTLWQVCLAWSNTLIEYSQPAGASEYMLETASKVLIASRLELVARDQF